MAAARARRGPPTGRTAGRSGWPPGAPRSPGARPTWSPTCSRRPDPGSPIEPVVVRTEGDRRADEPLERIGGQGVFVKEVQQAVLDGRADVAVHSAKDLPPRHPAGPRARRGAAARRRPRRPGRLDAGRPRPRRDGWPPARPGAGSSWPICGRTSASSRHGATSRRGSPRRGPTRPTPWWWRRRRWSGWASPPRPPRSSRRLVMLPQVGQGAIALECRPDDPTRCAARILAAIDDREPTARCVAERAMLRGARGVCALPVGGWAEPDGAGLRLRGMVASADGRVVLHAHAPRRRPRGPRGRGGPCAARRAAAGPSCLDCGRAADR